MSANDGNARFLELDAQAEQLVAELAALRDATNSYASAERELVAAEGAVRQLATELAAVSGKIGECVVAMREIGTPQLLAEQASTSERLTAAEAEVRRLVASTGQMVAGVDQRLGDLATGVDTLRGEWTAAAKQHSSDLTESIDAMRLLVDESRTRHEESAARVQTISDSIDTIVSRHVGGTEAQIRESFVALDVRVSSLRTLVRNAIVGFIIADLILAVLIALF